MHHKYLNTAQHSPSTRFEKSFRSINFGNSAPQGIQVTPRVGVCPSRDAETKGSSAEPEYLVYDDGSKIDPEYTEVSNDDEDEEDEAYYGPLFDRIQLGVSVVLPNGLYYVDTQYLSVVSAPPPFWDKPVEPYTEQLLWKIMDVPSYEVCFLVSGLRGGSKKKKSGKKKKKNMTPGITGHGAFNIGGLGKMLASVAKPIAHAAAKSAQQAATDAAIGTLVGGGAYRSRIKGKGAYSARSGMLSYTGKGAYNSLINPEGPPIHVAHRNDETGGVTIAYREYIRDIFSSGSDFTILGLSINPGLTVCPFLSQLAGNYKEYRFKKLLFFYVPTVANVTATGQLGTTMMAFSYNAGDPLFTNKTAMMGYSGSINDIISNHIAMGVECDTAKGNHGFRYVRTGAVPVGQDIKTYDIGMLQIATSGVNSTSFPAGTQIGELHVEYEIELLKPNISASAGNSIDVDQFLGFTGITVLNFFGTSPSRGTSNSIGGTITKTGTATYTFPDNFFGTVSVYFAFVGTVFTGTPSITPSGGGLAGVRPVTALYNGGYVSGNQAASSTSYIYQGYFNVTPAATTGANFITFATGTMGATSISAFNLIISSSNPGISTSVSGYVTV